ncbi:TonB-dependent receptor domain-containing protein [Magnetospirillum aberrantis]|uniref:TonB-dependent receptor n=1 Tax=Magnetospirillum aberrantis SpK TaxID=908842 RepID=A0A7C9QYA5_9PROT|nr:TonB-dependent receptor [Magnetospirillum aberrantis]NFV82276.1 TonB-dependent receptor [Magnetospirillum aberrantis SpK]
MIWIKGGQGMRGRGVRVSLLLAVAGLGGVDMAAAADPFVDTRVLPRHAGRTPPDLIAYEDALGGQTTFLYRDQRLSPYQPAFDHLAAAPQPVHAMAGLSEGSTAVQALRLRAAGDGWVAAAAARGESGHAYRDGAGTKLNFGYERESEWLGGRFGRQEDTQVTIGFARDVLEDAKLLNYGLDLRYLDQGGGRATVETRSLPGWFNHAGAQAAVFYLHLDADNYNLRAAPSVRLYADGLHRGMRANGWAAHDEAASRTLFGGEISHQTHAATRYGRDYGPAVITGYWVPGVELDRASLWAEHTRRFEKGEIQAGLRYDLVSMSAADAHTVPNAPVAVFAQSAQQLYEATYGPGIDNDSLDHNISGRLRGERRLAEGSLGFLDLSRMVRSPDHAERYSGNGGPAALVEVGNPTLRPERHYKAETGASVEGNGHRGYGRASPAGAWKVSGSVWHDRIEDFVSIDWARGQTGVVSTSGGQVYRNVDAAVSGVSADIQVNPAEHLAVRLNLTGQRGRNLSDGRPLYQMPPFEANLFLDTFGGDDDLGWNVGGRLRMVAAKRAVDSDLGDGSGLDTAGPAGGFATVDLYAGLNIGTNAAVGIGIDNLFDKLYREHIKAVPNTSLGVMPNAPGRTLTLRAMVSF